LGDFGLSCQLKNKLELKNTICGTPHYVSPEMIRGRNKGYSFESDIWSLGVVMYKLITG
jgi:serine/threonine protein kinase